MLWAGLALKGRGRVAWEGRQGARWPSHSALGLGRQPDAQAHRAPSCFGSLLPHPTSSRGSRVVLGEHCLYCLLSTHRPGGTLTVGREEGADLVPCGQLLPWRRGPAGPGEGILGSGQEGGLATSLETGTRLSPPLLARLRRGDSDRTRGLELLPEHRGAHAEPPAPFLRHAQHSVSAGCACGFLSLSHMSDDDGALSGHRLSRGRVRDPRPRGSLAPGLSRPHCPAEVLVVGWGLGPAPSAN